MGLKRSIAYVLLCSTLVGSLACNSNMQTMPMAAGNTVQTDMVAKDTTSVGWTNPIVLNEAEYQVPLGMANSPISGTSISAIVTNPAVSVRSDGNSCISCHAGPGSLRPEFTSATLDINGFCQLVPSFINANKPQVLKDVFNVWYSKGCPQ